MVQGLPPRWGTCAPACSTCRFGRRELARTPETASYKLISTICGGGRRVAQLVGKYFDNGTERILSEQLAQSPFGMAKIEIVTKLRFDFGCGDARLIRVELPGMQIHDRRVALAVDFVDGPGSNCPRGQTKI